MHVSQSALSYCMNFSIAPVCIIIHHLEATVMPLSTAEYSGYSLSLSGKTSLYCCVVLHLSTCMSLS